MHVLQIENGAYMYKMPFGIYPEFEKHKAGSPQAYEFEFEGTITSNRIMGYVSCPEGSKTDRKNEK